MTSSVAEAPVKKVSKSETGHYKNLANLNSLIGSLKSYGTQYNPSNADLSVESLETLSGQIVESISNETAAEIAHRNAVHERQEAYEGMSSLATRIYNAVAACAGKSETANAKSYTNKIRGGGKKKAVDVTNEATRSTSQMSFDNRMNNLSGFCRFLASIPEYKPNETDLQISSITVYIQSLASLNYTVNITWNELANARLERDRLLYADKTGALHIVQSVKKYAKSVFGSGSPEYKRISGLRFTQM